MNNKTKFQKIIIVVALLVSACLLIGSLAFVNSNWQVLRAVGQRVANNGQTFYWDGLDGESAVQIANGWTDAETNLYYFDFWKEIQNANNGIFYTSIAGFAAIAIAAIAGNFSRRKFYISNLVCGLIYPIVTVVGSIITFVQMGKVSSEFTKCADDFQLYYQLQVAKLEKYNQSTDGLEVISGKSIIAYYIILAIAIIFAVLFCYVTITKFLKTYPRNNKENKLEPTLNTFAEEK